MHLQNHADICLYTALYTHIQCQHRHLVALLSTAGASAKSISERNAEVTPIAESTGGTASDTTSRLDPFAKENMQLAVVKPANMVVLSDLKKRQGVSVATASTELPSKDIKTIKVYR
jgi:hypothetical protein